MIANPEIAEQLNDILGDASGAVFVEGSKAHVTKRDSIIAISETPVTREEMVRLIRATAPPAKVAQLDTHPDFLNYQVHVRTGSYRIIYTVRKIGTTKTSATLVINRIPKPAKVLDLGNTSFVLL